MKKSDKERLKKIVATWESLKAEMHKRGITPELLLEDEFSQWAVTTPLYNIGEQVYQLSPEFKASYPEQPWNMVRANIGLGNTGGQRQGNSGKYQVKCFHVESLWVDLFKWDQINRHNLTHP